MAINSSFGNKRADIVFWVTSLNFLFVCQLILLIFFHFMDEYSTANIILLLLYVAAQSFAFEAKQILKEINEL